MDTEWNGRIWNMIKIFIRFVLGTPHRINGYS